VDRYYTAELEFVRENTSAETQVEDMGERK
jgi:hypothetical protein